MAFGFLDVFNILTQEPVRESSIVQAIWLTSVILFVVGVVVSGLTAKQINNLHNPTYAKAFIAQFLINPISLAMFVFFAFYFKAHPLLSLVIAFSLVPIVIYKLAFSCAMWREAALIWLVTFFVQGVVGIGLAMVGILKIAEVIQG